MVWGFATKRNYFKVCSVKILVTYLSARRLHLALACGRRGKCDPTADELLNVYYSCMVVMP